MFLLTSLSTPIYNVFAADTDYKFLAPLPELPESFNPTQASNLGGYLNLMIKLFIGICAVLSVIMIVAGGIEYMTSELPGLKSAGKERIIQAILGLLLALGAWTLLYTINPDLLNSDLKSLEKVEVSVQLRGLTFHKQPHLKGVDMLMVLSPDPLCLEHL